MKQRRLRVEKTQSSEEIQRVFFIGENTMNEIGENNLRSFVDSEIQDESLPDSVLIDDTDDEVIIID